MRSLSPPLPSSRGAVAVPDLDQHVANDSWDLQSQSRAVGWSLSLPLSASGGSPGPVSHSRGEDQPSARQTRQSGKENQMPEVVQVAVSHLHFPRPLRLSAALATVTAGTETTHVTRRCTGRGKGEPLSVKRSQGGRGMINLLLLEEDQKGEIVRKEETPKGGWGWTHTDSTETTSTVRSHQSVSTLAGR
jgi:hypothetical protein